MTFILNVALALCATAAVFHAIRMHVLDRHLQAHRAPQAPWMSYLFVPLRWRRDLYTRDAAPLVDAARHNLRRLYAWGLIAALLSLVRNGAGP